MAFAYESNKHQEAKTIINDCLKTVKTFYPYLKDKDIKRVLEIAERYAKIIDA